MISAMVLFCVCMMLLVMFFIMCALWDILNGYWGKAERERGKNKIDIYSTIIKFMAL